MTTLLYWVPYLFAYALMASFCAAFAACATMIILRELVDRWRSRG